jgi:hypothetical protein
MNFTYLHNFIHIIWLMIYPRLNKHPTSQVLGHLVGFVITPLKTKNEKNTFYPPLSISTNITYQMGRWGTGIY